LAFLLKFYWFSISFFNQSFWCIFFQFSPHSFYFFYFLKSFSFQFNPLVKTFRFPSHLFFYFYFHPHCFNYIFFFYFRTFCIIDLFLWFHLLTFNLLEIELLDCYILWCFLTNDLDHKFEKLTHVDIFFLLIFFSDFSIQHYFFLKLVLWFFSISFLSGYPGLMIGPLILQVNPNWLAPYYPSYMSITLTRVKPDLFLPNFVLSKFFFKLSWSFFI